MQGNCHKTAVGGEETIVKQLEDARKKNCHKTDRGCEETVVKKLEVARNCHEHSKMEDARKL
jgi:hypothetical protein